MLMDVQKPVKNFVFKMLFVAWPMLCQAAVGDGELRLEKVWTETQVHHEFCDNDYDFLKDKVCLVSDQRQLKIYLPDDFAQVIARHVDAMELWHSFDKMDPADFFHGHLIVRGSQVRYGTLNAYLQDVSGILYHTHEYEKAWNKKIPRSLFGQMDGDLVPAIRKVVPKNLSPSYENTGTIYSADIVEAHPELSRLEFTMSASADVQLEVSNKAESWLCNPKPQF
jgi:hypothetical protein